MKVSIVIATAGRTSMFRDMLFSLYDTVSTFRFNLENEIEIVAVIDEDMDAVEIALEYDIDKLDFSMRKRGALFAWNKGLEISTGDIIVPAGDDQLFYPNWLEYALESHQNRLDGYGVVGMNDLAYDGNLQLATMLLFDRKYCKEVMGGVIAPPVYHYYCVDSEWNAKAKALGKFYWDERSKVEHLHWAHGKRPLDNLDQEKVDAGWTEMDNKTFEDRKAQGFPVTWEGLI